MRNIPRFISKQISRVIPETLLFKIETPVFLPFYHTVSNKNLPYILNYPYRNSAEFEKELDFFLKYFTPVSLEKLIRHKNSSKKIFHLSFDDGLKECSEIIAPVLLKKGIPATFFINAGFADNVMLFHRYKASLVLAEILKKQNSEAEIFLKNNNLEGPKILQAGISKNEILNETARILGIDFSVFLASNNPYLNTKQIVQLQNLGFTIGAHSYNHPEFWEIGEEEQFEQVKKSMDWVNEKIKPKIKAFAFPFTDDSVSKNVLQKIIKENICDITFGTAGIKYDEIGSHFQRYPVEQHGDFILNLKTELTYLKLRKIVGKASVKH